MRMNKINERFIHYSHKKDLVVLDPTSFKIINNKIVYNKKDDAPVEAGSVVSLMEYFVWKKFYKGYVDYERGVVVLFTKVDITRRIECYN